MYERPKIITRNGIMVMVAMVGVLAIWGFSVQMHHARVRSRWNAMVGNLRSIGSAAEQFMGEKNRTQVSYWDLVGPGTDKFVRSVSPAAGEDYTGIVVCQTSTQIFVSNPMVGTVTYNL